MSNKIIYIKQNLSFIRNYIDSSIISCFEKEGMKVLSFDFGEILNHSIINASALEEYKDFGIIELRALCMQATMQKVMSFINVNKADIVFFVNGEYLQESVLSQIKTLGMKLVAWQVDDPYIIDKTKIIGKYADYLFTVDSSTIDEYKNAGCNNVHNMPLGFNKTIYKKQKVEERYYSDICFIGTPFNGSYRLKIINDLITFFSGTQTLIRLIGSHVNGETWGKYLTNTDSSNVNIIEGMIEPEETAKYYCGAKINLNIHRDSYNGILDRNENRIIAESVNERTFNIAGCGGFQIIDNKRNDIDKYFASEKEIIIFDSSDDLMKKAAFYLANEEERKQIAAKSYIRANNDHSLDNRIGSILKIIN